MPSAPRRSHSADSASPVLSASTTAAKSSSAVENPELCSDQPAPCMYSSHARRRAGIPSSRSFVLGIPSFVPAVALSMLSRFPPRSRNRQRVRCHPRPGTGDEKNRECSSCLSA
eukprot:859239-Rhodomonas_salina.1